MAGTSVWGCGAASYANGVGSAETVFSPKLATATQNVGPYISLSAGNMTSMGVSADHKVYIWGEDAQTASLIDINISVYQHHEASYGCLLGVDGSVWTWGKSDDFLTGLATELPVHLKVGGPLRLEGFDSRVIKASLGAKHSAALTEKGTVYTWGVGPGIGIDPVLLPAPAIDIAVGDGFTLVCTTDGSAYTWGDLAQSEDEWKPKSVTFLGNPANLKITAVAAGDRHAIVLADSGVVYVWGANDLGELGSGTDKEPKKAPIKLSLSNIVSIKAYKSSSFAIANNGDVYTWGSNVWGHLGLGHIKAISQPTIVSAFSPQEASANTAAAEGVKVLDVVTGFNHTLFLVAPRSSTTPITPAVHKFSGDPLPYPLPDSPIADPPKGQLWTTGSIVATGSEPSDEVVIWRPSPQWENKPVVSATTSARAAWNVLGDGFLFAWGNGTLGTGEEAQSAQTPMRLWDLDGHRITRPTGDWAMAITDKGKVYAWGEGTDFRTGLGGTARSQFPKMLEFSSPVKCLALGQTHGIAVTEDYGVYTWGAGKGLGTGGRTTIERAPKRIPGLETLGVCTVSAGRGFSTMVTLSGDAYSWGDATDGKTGHDDGGENLSPTLMTAFAELKVVQVVSGLQFSLALIEDGSVYSWGHGSEGCLGLGPHDLTPKTKPHKIPFFEAAGKIAFLIASGASAFAISQTCALYAWGTPHLGVGTGRQIATPTRVASLQKHNVQGVAPGEWQALAWMGSKITPAPLAPGLAPPWGPVPTAPEEAPSIILDSGPVPVEGGSSSESGSASGKNSPLPDRPALGRMQSKLDVKPGHRYSVGPPPPDATKLALHIKSIEGVPAMHKFFPDEPELDKLAQMGNIDEVRKFLNSHKAYEPSDVQAEAIKKCYTQVKKDETVIKGWIIYSINKQDFESERILVVSDKAHYRFKYDFKKQTVVHSKRYAAIGVYQLLCGRFKDVSKVSAKVRGPIYEKQCGIQIWTSDPADWKPPSVILPFQKVRVPYTIYRPFMGSDSTVLQQERVCHEICLAIEASVHWYRNGSAPIEYMHEFIVDAPKRFDGFPPFPARKVAFIPRAPLTLSSGLLSVAHNKWLVKK